MKLFVKGIVIVVLVMCSLVIYRISMKGNKFESEAKSARADLQNTDSLRLPDSRDILQPFENSGEVKGYELQKVYEFHFNQNDYVASEVKSMGVDLGNTDYFNYQIQGVFYFLLIIARVVRCMTLVVS